MATDDSRVGNGGANEMYQHSTLTRSLTRPLTNSLAHLLIYRGNGVLVGYVVESGRRCGNTELC